MCLHCKLRKFAYTVTVKASQCPHGKECIPQCIQGKCSAGTCSDVLAMTLMDTYVNMSTTFKVCINIW